MPISTSVYAPRLRSRRRSTELPGALRAPDPRQGRAPHRRLLHLGVAQAGSAADRALRPPAVAFGPLRGFREQRQRDLCRRRAQPACRAAGPPHDREPGHQRLLCRRQLSLDLGNQPGPAGDRDGGPRRDHRQTPGRAVGHPDRPHRARDHRTQAADRLQHPGGRGELPLLSRPASRARARAGAHPPAASHRPELQPVRTRTSAHRAARLSRPYHLFGLLREHRHAGEPQLRAPLP